MFLSKLITLAAIVASAASIPTLYPASEADIAPYESLNLVVF